MWFLSVYEDQVNFEQTLVCNRRRREMVTVIVKGHINFINELFNLSYLIQYLLDTHQEEQPVSEYIWFMGVWSKGEHVL